MKQMDIFNSFDNIYGGQDAHMNGSNYQTQPNIYHGEDLYQDGHLVSSSKPNILGGLDIQNADHQQVLSTKANFIGGHDIFNADGSFVGHTTTDGQSFQGMDGSSSTIAHHGNMSTIISMDDPLAHATDAKLPMLIL